jgi:hypothetical protein
VYADHTTVTIENTTIVWCEVAPGDYSPNGSYCGGGGGTAGPGGAGGAGGNGSSYFPAAPGGAGGNGGMSMGGDSCNIQNVVQSVPSPKGAAIFNHLSGLSVQSCTIFSNTIGDGSLCNGGCGTASADGEGQVINGVWYSDASLGGNGGPGGNGTSAAPNGTAGLCLGGYTYYLASSYLSGSVTGGGTVRNTIIAGTAFGVPGGSPDLVVFDVAGTFTSQGPNFIGLQDPINTNFGGNGDIVRNYPYGPSGLDPMLNVPYALPGCTGPDGLALNGGPTGTLAPFFRSQVVGAGDPALAGTTDQRGVTRTAPIDIGAFQTEVAYFAVSAASSTTGPGQAVKVTVTPYDQFGNVVGSYAGTIHFTSSDRLAQLPPDHTFVGSDYFLALDKTLSLETSNVTLVTAGTQTITVTDTVQANVTGSTSVQVVIPRPGVVTHFSVSLPASQLAGASFSYTVAALDAFNQPVAGYCGTVHISSSDPQVPVLGDYTFTSADRGVHTFSGVLKTAGTQTISVFDKADPQWTGSGQIIIKILAAPGLPLPGTVTALSPLMTASAGATAGLTSGTGRFANAASELSFIRLRPTAAATKAALDALFGSAGLESPFAALSHPLSSGTFF